MKRLRKEILNNKLIYFLLFGIAALAFFIRIYRVDELLGFYFDQGRDALVIWDLIKNGELFLIGPTTGLAGIFRGPYYYYLLAPFYFLGNGNPIWPSIFLCFTTILALLTGYYLGSKLQSRMTGLIFAVLAGFSYFIFLASRWLSNPTPMLFLSLILVWAMFEVIRGKKWAWGIISLAAGLSLFNFGSSGELFYFVTLAIFFIWQFKKKPDRRNVIIAITLFFFTFAPLLLFDLKHERILSNNITKTFAEESSFTLPTKFLFETRNQFYSNLFPRLIFHSFGEKENISLLVILVSFLIFLPSFLKDKKTKVLLLLMVSPILGLYFYQGNDTVLYDYYMTGYFLIFLLLIAVILGKLWNYKFGKVFVLYFLILFLRNNYEPIKYTLENNLEGRETIALLNQRRAIDWIYTDAAGEKFNKDVYVPPVIPYAYDYLFTWLGTTKYRYIPDEEHVERLYTLYEVDPPHPERLQAWLDRQKGIGTVEKQAKFGGITVERRKRL